ncbi:MAG: hypothetical protein ACTH0S_04350 [Senegalia sp. (in: firmicutes)]
MKKRLKILGMLILMLILFPQQGQAVELDNIENIQPLFTNINTFQSTFDIASNGKLSNTVYLNSRNADRIKINTYLQQYSSRRWTTIKSWSGSRNSTSYGFTNNWYVNKGYSYRLVSYGYIYKDNKIVESTSRISQTLTY